MAAHHYVYILISESQPDEFYIGLTDNLAKRLVSHNAGLSAHTAKFRPWRLRVAIAFPSREKAAAFERYLKTHSCRRDEHRLSPNNGELPRGR